VSEQITDRPQNKVTDVNGQKLSFTFAPSTGMFKGRMPTPVRKSRSPFNGVVLRAGRGTNYFRNHPKREGYLICAVKRLTGVCH
jgi:hypothetical protein